MNRFRSAALIASVLCAAVLVSPAFATGPVTSPAALTAADVGVTAVGIGVAQSPTDPLAIGQTLYISVQSTTNLAGVQGASDQMLAKLDAIKSALVQAGVPADGIRMTGFNVNPMYGPSMGGPSPIVDKNQTPLPVSALSLNGNLSADVASIKLLVAAMNAATEAGASTVNANAGKGSGPFGTVQPSAADLAKATKCGRGERAHQRRGNGVRERQETRRHPLDLVHAAADDGMLPAKYCLDGAGHGDVRLRQ